MKTTPPTPLELAGRLHFAASEREAPASAPHDDDKARALYDAAKTARDRALLLSVDATDAHNIACIEGCTPAEARILSEQADHFLTAFLLADVHLMYTPVPEPRPARWLFSRPAAQAQGAAA